MIEVHASLTELTGPAGSLCCSEKAGVQARGLRKKADIVEKLRVSLTPPSVRAPHNDAESSSQDDSEPSQPAVRPLVIHHECGGQGVLYGELVKLCLICHQPLPSTDADVVGTALLWCRHAYHPSCVANVPIDVETGLLSHCPAYSSYISKLWDKVQPRVNQSFTTLASRKARNVGHPDSEAVAGDSESESSLSDDSDDCEPEPG